jgi:predicted Rossmann-fold nucleotide-binding protein
VLPGGLGTLEELLEVWTSRALGLHNKPIVVLDADGIFNPLRDQLVHLVQSGFAQTRAVEEVSWASDISSAFDLLEAGHGTMLGWA